MAELMSGADIAFVRMCSNLGRRGWWPCFTGAFLLNEKRESTISWFLKDYKESYICLSNQLSQW